MCSSSSLPIVLSVCVLYLCHSHFHSSVIKGRNWWELDLFDLLYSPSPVIINHKLSLILCLCVYAFVWEYICTCTYVFICVWPPPIHLPPHEESCLSTVQCFLIIIDFKDFPYQDNLSKITHHCMKFEPFDMPFKGFPWCGSSCRSLPFSASNCLYFPQNTITFLASCLSSFCSF